MAEKANAPNWKKIKAEYLRGGTSYGKLAQKYGIPKTTIASKAKREGWGELQQEISDETRTKVVQKIAEKESDLLAELTDMQAKAARGLYKKMLSDISEYPNGAGTRIVRETVKVKEIELDGGVKKKIPLRSSITTDFESLVRALATLGKLYGLDAGSELDKRRLELMYNPFGSEEPEDDGFLDALSKECAESWVIADEPANLNDRDDGGGED